MLSGDSFHACSAQRGRLSQGGLVPAQQLRLLDGGRLVFGRLGEVKEAALAHRLDLPLDAPFGSRAENGSAAAARCASSDLRYPADGVHGVFTCPAGIVRSLEEGLVPAASASEVFVGMAVGAGHAGTVRSRRAPSLAAAISFEPIQ
ncbi:hypothetical protein [Streptomyces sp. NPDC047974]|uniref:hypothetical protein n=1 Tax=Streptomyces sp. NPDC047974 TaxID=3154343 RepID=UPI0033D9BE21